MKGLLILTAALLPLTSWSRDCGTEVQAERLRAALVGRPIGGAGGKIFQPGMALDAVCFNASRHWAALTHWTDAAGAHAMVFGLGRVVARQGDSVDGRYIAAFTSDSRVEINGQGRAAFSAWFSDSQESWLRGETGQFGVFAETAIGTVRFVRAMGSDPDQVPNWTLMDDGRVVTTPETRQSQQRPARVAAPRAGALPPAEASRLEEDPDYRRLAPDKQAEVRATMEKVHNVIVQRDMNALRQVQLDITSRQIRGIALCGHLADERTRVEAVSFNQAREQVLLISWPSEIGGVAHTAIVTGRGRCVVADGVQVDGKRILRVLPHSLGISEQSAMVAYEALYAGRDVNGREGAEQRGAFIENRFAAELDPHSASPLAKFSEDDRDFWWKRDAETLDAKPGVWRVPSVAAAPARPPAMAGAPVTTSPPPAPTPERSQPTPKPQDCVESPKAKKPRIRLRMPKALENLGRQVGVEMNDDAEETVPCPVPATPPAKDKGAKR